MKYVNPHCHLLNFDFVPDDFVKTRASIASEWMVRNKATSVFLFGLEKIIPIKRLKRLREMVNIFKMDITAVALVFLEEMDEANIEIACPLMMDMAQSSFGDVAEISYPYQIELISEICNLSGGRLRPFVMFDPRRPNAFKLVKKALEEYCFYGVKMYTKLGYHPDPDSFYNTGNNPGAKEKLYRLYEYCESESIPIIAHCSPGGAYSDKLMRSRSERDMLVHPQSWIPVLKKYPKLKLDLAHMGGGPDEWWPILLDMMKQYENLYTDTAYCDWLFKNSCPIIEMPDYAKSRIMFATDWSMTRHTWTEKEWTDNFLKVINVDWQKDLMRNNALEFINSNLCCDNG